ncbi:MULTISPECIES: thioesterase family protein [Rhodobacterales]|uniref:acyl-CoA thioesterase n=1 Tax=Roseobacter sp. N2S TaxID=2663844 RepID=UPI002866D1E3|nr:MULTISPECIES: thioesterase family protein [Rhodobacterales]MDR6263463.1 4-hydroxybenzoyl-CoA thioesterase [Roseobacter sp. N2S]
MGEPVHSSLQTVRFQHCDPAGIVFYPRYFEMLNLTVEHFFEQKIGLSFNSLPKELNVSVPTVHLETDFVKVSYLEDRLDFQLRIERIGRSSLNLSVISLCNGEERLKAAITLVCVNFTSKHAVPWPDLLRSKFGTLMEQ